MNSAIPPTAPFRPARSAWTGPGQVLLHDADERSVRGHAAYADAKAGDREAAFTLVDDILSVDVVKILADTLPPRNLAAAGRRGRGRGYQCNPAGAGEQIVTCAGLAVGNAHHPGQRCGPDQERWLLPACHSTDVRWPGAGRTRISLGGRLRRARRDARQPAWVRDSAWWPSRGLHFTHRQNCFGYAGASAGDLG